MFKLLFIFYLTEYLFDSVVANSENLRWSYLNDESEENVRRSAPKNRPELLEPGVSMHKHSHKVYKSAEEEPPPVEENFVDQEADTEMPTTKQPHQHMHIKKHKSAEEESAPVEENFVDQEAETEMSQPTTQEPHKHMHIKKHKAYKSTRRVEEPPPTTDENDYMKNDVIAKKIKRRHLRNKKPIRRSNETAPNGDSKSIKYVVEAGDKAAIFGSHLFDPIKMKFDIDDETCTQTTIPQSAEITTLSLVRPTATGEPDATTGSSAPDMTAPPATDAPTDGATDAATDAPTDAATEAATEAAPEATTVPPGLFKLLDADTTVYWRANVDSRPLVKKKAKTEALQKYRSILAGVDRKDDKKGAIGHIEYRRGKTKVSKDKAKWATNYIESAKHGMGEKKHKSRRHQHLKHKNNRLSKIKTKSKHATARDF